jgi:hypothetical protein
MLQDPLLPCVTRIVTGGPISGSWWGHPSGGAIYELMTTLESDSEILQTKLVSGKVTMVHRDLWPSILAVGAARAAWQFCELSRGAVWLLAEVERDSSVQTDLLTPPPGIARKSVPAAARELEQRLLVHADEVHTPSGAHAKVLETWSLWRNEAGMHDAIPSEDAGRKRLEQVVERLNRDFNASGRLPWHSHD